MEGGFSYYCYYFCYHHYYYATTATITTCYLFLSNSLADGHFWGEKLQIVSTIIFLLFEGVVES